MQQQITANVASFPGRKQVVMRLSDGAPTIGGAGCATNDIPCQISYVAPVATSFKINNPNIPVVSV